MMLMALLLCLVFTSPEQTARIYLLVDIVVRGEITPMEDCLA